MIAVEYGFAAFKKQFSHNVHYGERNVRSLEPFIVDETAPAA